MMRGAQALKSSFQRSGISLQPVEHRLKGREDLVYPVPNGGLRCRGQQTADCSFGNATKGASRLLYDCGIGYSGELGLKRSNLGFGSLLLASSKA